MDEIITPKTVKVVENEGMPVYDEQEEKTLITNPNRGRLFITFNILFPAKMTEESQLQVTKILNPQ